MLIQLGGVQFHLFEIPFLALLLAAAVVVFVARRKPDSSRFLSRITLTFFIFALYLTAILLSAVNAYSVEIVLRSFLKWCEVWLIAVLVFYVISTKNQWHAVYWFLFLSNFAFILLVLVQIAIGSKSILAYRIFPDYESVISFALILPFVATKRRALALALILISLFSAIMSLSRSSYLPLFLCIMYGLTFLPRKLRKVTFLLLALFLMSLLSMELVRNYLFARWEMFFSFSLGSNVERINMLKIAWRAFVESPIVGVGSLNLGQFVIYNGLTHLVRADTLPYLTPHNAFMQVLAEEGLIGFTFFVSLLILLFSNLKSAMKSHILNDKYIQGLMGFFIVFLSNLAFGYISSQFRFFYGIFIGLTAAALKELETKEIEKSAQ